MAGPKDCYAAPKCKTPGLHLLVGSFETDGTNAPSVIKGAGFTVGAPNSGVYTITLADGKARHAIGLGPPGLEDSTTNANDTVRWGDLDAIPTAGTFTIITASAAGTDANLDGPVVHFAMLISNTPVNK